MVFNKNYSKWIRPILYGIDLCLILISTYLFLTKDSKNIIVFLFLWVVLSIVFSFYSVYRFTKITKVVSLLSKQLFVFILLVISYVFIIDSIISSKSIVTFFSILFVILIFGEFFYTLCLRSTV